jgi:hypothetical protein
LPQEGLEKLSHASAEHEERMQEAARAQWKEGRSGGIKMQDEAAEGPSDEGQQAGHNEGPGAVEFVKRKMEQLGDDDREPVNKTG